MNDPCRPIAFLERPVFQPISFLALAPGRPALAQLQARRAITRNAPAASTTRRGGGAAASAAQTNDHASGTERTSKIAAAVAERYAKSKSYRTFLAEEAERSIRQAEAAAEIAALNARAVAEAQYDLLEKLDQYAAEPAPAPVLLPSPEAARPEPVLSASLPVEEPMLFEAAPAKPAEPTRT